MKLNTPEEISFQHAIPMGQGTAGSVRIARTSSRPSVATQSANSRRPNWRHAGPGVGQGPRPGGLRRARRRVPRRLAHRRALPHDVRARARPLCGRPAAPLRQQRVERQPRRAERPDEPKTRSAGRAAHGAGRRSPDRRRRLPDTVNPIMQNGCGRSSSTSSSTPYNAISIARARPSGPRRARS